MINDILTLIQNRLSEKEPNIRYMDEDWGQLDYYNDSPPIQWPCVLVDLASANWQNQGQKVQDAPFMISITVADIKQSNTSFRAPATQKQKAAAIWMILENIHKALHGWKPTGGYYGSLSRVSTKKVKRDDGIRQFEVVYLCTCYDDSATEMTYNIADPEVSERQFGIDVPAVIIEAKIAVTD